MNLRELQRLARAALADASPRDELQRATGMASSLAEMVGWAPGAIDPRGEVLAGLDGIRSIARARFEVEQSPESATLHDAIADLTDAIARHDRDLAAVADVSCEP